MDKTFRISNFLLILIFVFASLLHAKEEVSILSKVDKTKINLDQTLTLIVSLEGNFKKTPTIKLPSLKEFEVVATTSSYNFSLRAKETSTIYNFQYVLKPKIEGKISIGSVELKYKDRFYKTEPIEIEVMASLKEVPQKPPPPYQEGVPKEDIPKSAEKITL
jgi:hypothetical protein